RAAPARVGAPGPHARRALGTARGHPARIAVSDAGSRHPGSALLVLLLALAVAGCRGDTRAALPLELWAMGGEGEVAAELMPAFEHRHPGVRVRVQQIPWSAAHEKLLTAYVGGALPDVFQAGNTWLPELEALGALEPLDARIAASTAVARD